MSIDKTVAVLGAGNLGGALIAGLLESGAAPERLIATDAREQRVRELASRHPIRITVGGNREAASAAEIIVLAVKPPLVRPVIEEIRGELSAEKTLVSLAAGVPLSAIEAAAGAEVPAVRVMPNIAMTVGESASALCPNRRVSAEARQAVAAIFEAVGAVVFVEEEKMHAVTALSGSGPAYVFLILEALTAGGVKAGLTRDEAFHLAAQTLRGAAKLARNSGLHPAELRDQVTTPGGTTIAGLHQLELHGVRAALIDAVEAATERSRELSR